MEKFGFESAVHGYHVYRDVWEPRIGEKLIAKQEFDNPMDKFAVKVTKSNKMVGHLPPMFFRVLAHGGEFLT